MRDEIPADYEQKKETFLLHLSKAINDHNIPDALICGGDETTPMYFINGLNVQGVDTYDEWIQTLDPLLDV